MTMRPPGSLPRTLDKSMPNSRASRRTDGDAAGATIGFDAASPAFSGCFLDRRLLGFRIAGAGARLAAGSDPAARLAALHST